MFLPSKAEIEEHFNTVTAFLTGTIVELSKSLSGHIVSIDEVDAHLTGSNPWHITNCLLHRGN